MLEPLSEPGQYQGSMISLEISDHYQGRVDPGILERAAQATLTSRQEHPTPGVTIVITDDAQLQRLNREFLGINAPTDVLSFPANYVDPETGEFYLGDIIISYPQAASQATIAEQPIENELQLLVVHGILHLLGYDHQEDEEKDRMWAIQESILLKLGISPGKLAV
jgi:probable rRNA maturation factor